MAHREVEIFLWLIRNHKFFWWPIRNLPFFKLDSAQLLMESIPVCYNYIVRLLFPLLNHPYHVGICFQACPVWTLQRQEYDFEEDIRNARKRSSKGRSVHRSPGNGSFNPRQWQSSRGSSRRWYRYSDDYWWIYWQLHKVRIQKVTFASCCFWIGARPPCTFFLVSFRYPCWLPSFYWHTLDPPQLCSACWVPF
jgi:hypothetical protein